MSKDPLQEALDKFERAGISLESKNGYEYGVEDGVAQERERIIKLLEEDQPCVLAECYPGDFCNCYQIALIKGENK